MTVYSIFNPPGDPGLDFTHEIPLTQQQFLDSCDVNLLVERALRSGDDSFFSLPDNNNFHDVSFFDDYIAAVDEVERARQLYEGLDCKDDFPTFDDFLKSVSKLQNLTVPKVQSDEGVSSPEGADASASVDSEATPVTS